MELNNIKPLDGLRALAIFLVLVWHYFDGQVKSTNNVIYCLKFLTYFSWSGVDLFFILSGFLIGSKNYFKSFYMRRVLRIFPAYYLILFGFGILLFTGLSSHFTWFSMNGIPFYSYLFYIQNFWMKNGFGGNWMGVTWSLALEEQFYLVLPLLIFVINPKHFPKLLVACIISAPIFRTLFHGFNSYVLFPARMDSLFLGVLIAYYYLNGTIEKIFKQRKRLLLLLLTISLLSLYLTDQRTNLWGIGGVYFHSLLALFYGTLLVLVLVADKNSLFIKALSNPFMSFIARISYMVYLTHDIFLGIFHQLILKNWPQINNYKSFLVTLLALITTIIFSTISYYVFEKPILSFGKKYKY